MSADKIKTALDNAIRSNGGGNVKAAINHIVEALRHLSGGSEAPEAPTISSLPVIRRVMPTIIADGVDGVAPMVGPFVGENLIAALRTKYADAEKEDSQDEVAKSDYKPLAVMEDHFFAADQKAEELSKEDAPERKVFYIDTGSMPPETAKKHIEEIKKEIKSRRATKPVVVNKDGAPRRKPGPKPKNKEVS
jgi:hypothetical protein